MEPKTEAEEVAEAYGSTLSELDSISKVDINALTMLAEDSKDYAIQIAACIEHHLKTGPNKSKLPILYLIDSICKNFPKSIYVELFTQNIVSNFCRVFEVSPEKTRKCLHKLRMTWGATNTFPQKKLNAIDERVHEMDPNWPVLHKISAQANHQKQQSKQEPSHQQSTPQDQQGLQQSGSTDMITNKANGIRNKQPKTKPVKRIRNNVNNANNNNINSNNNNNSNPGQIQPPATIVDNLTPQPLQPQNSLIISGQQPIHQISIFPQHIQTPVLLQQQTLQPPSQLPQQQAFEGMYQLQAQYQSQTVFPQPPLQPVLPNPPLTTLDQSSFINTPAFTPAIPQNFSQQPQQSIVDNRQHQNSPPTLPNDLDITLNSLYGGKQCSNCSLRFDDNNKYAIHLDWHFRQNLKSDNMFARRKWNYPLNLWVQFREINDDEIQESNNSDSTNVNDLLISHNDNEVPTAPASKEDEKNICSVCHETFEKFWAEEEEEWRLRNARLHDDQRVYHPLCLMDMLQANADK